MRGIVFQDCLAVYLTCVATFPLLFTNTSTGDIQCLPFAYSLTLSRSLQYSSPSIIHEMLIEYSTSKLLFVSWTGYCCVKPGNEAI